MSSWRRLELAVLCIYAVGFYLVVIRKSLRLSRDYSGRLYGLRAGSLTGHLNDLSDAQWRNFRGNLPVLTIVMGAFLILANSLRYCYGLKGRGASLLWLLLVGFILVIALINYSIVKLFAQYKHCVGLIWSFNLTVLILNRVYEGYSFSLFGQKLAFLDNHRVVLRMISFGCDYCWSLRSSHFDHKERGLVAERYTLLTYLCYLTYAPLYIAGPIVSYNAFAAQLDVPQRNYSIAQISWYGVRWILSFFLMEVMTHFFHYNAFVISRLWQQLSPLEIFIISYGVGGVETPENMPRYLYIPLGGAQRKLLSIWVATSVLGLFIHRELSAIAGAVTISCLMVANLVGYVVGPSGIKLLMTQMLGKDALTVLAFIFISFYVGVKLMFHIRDARQNHG
uniref:Uncharacterized protein n=1 Tax=Leersia perrieri TaxID=77586 RepID=A0A0D9WCN8_9ORYZ